MINQRLKQLRTENHLTQAQLAEILGIAKTTLAAYEQGKSEPNIELLIRMSNYFCVTVDYLIGKTDKKETNCSNSAYQPIADSLGIDEKTIEILLLLSATTYKYSNLDYLEAIIQHPQFPALLDQINNYITSDAQGWHDISVPDSNGNIINTISSDMLKTYSMQLIQTSFKGIVEGIPYSKHFLNKK